MLQITVLDLVEEPLASSVFPRPRRLRETDQDPKLAIIQEFLIKFIIILVSFVINQLFFRSSMMPFLDSLNKLRRHQGSSQRWQGTQRFQPSFCHRRRHWTSTTSDWHLSLIHATISFNLRFQIIQGQIWVAINAEAFRLIFLTRAEIIYWNQTVFCSKWSVGAVTGGIGV